MQESETTSGVSAALEAGEQIGTLKAKGHVYAVAEKAVPFVMVPEGFEIKTVESHLPAPLLIRSTVRTDDHASFVAYVNRYKDQSSVVFADLAGRKFEAVLDYHQAIVPNGPQTARWGKHRVTLSSDVTPDWKTWAEKSGKPMSQVDFARFIEDHIPNIADPSGALLLEIATTLEAKKDVNFRSSARLHNGEHQFKYEESIQGTAGSQAGQLQIPNAFVLGLAPFQGLDPRRVDARFRYRIAEGGKLSLWFELVRAQDVLEQAFTELVASVGAAIAPTLVLAGAAPTIG